MNAVVDKHFFVKKQCYFSLVYENSKLFIQSESRKQTFDERGHQVIQIRRNVDEKAWNR
jgi:hypothetical protein